MKDSKLDFNLKVKVRSLSVEKLDDLDELLSGVILAVESGKEMPAHDLVDIGKILGEYTVFTFDVVKELQAEVDNQFEMLDGP